MIIIFADKNPNVITALKSYFNNESNIQFYCSDIFDHKADAIVSPANSFGWMDGGIDYAYSKHFGWGLQEKLRTTLSLEFDGELLVGNSIAISTGDNLTGIPWLISAPTMRVPMNIATTNNVYLAFKSALKTASSMGFKSILTPGFGVMTGGVHPTIAAYQMKRAYDEVILRKPVKYINLMEAMQDHYQMIGMKVNPI